MKNEIETLSVWDHFRRPVEDFTAKVITLGSVTVWLVLNLVNLF